MSKGVNFAKDYQPGGGHLVCLGFTCVKRSFLKRVLKKISDYFLLHYYLIHYFKLSHTLYYN